MRTTDRIGFKLVIKEPEAEERTVVVCPRYDGLKMRWNRNNGGVYHTLNIEGNIEFWGVDFATVNACSLRTVFGLVVFVKGRGEVGRCEFRKTDCKWDIDHKICTVDITTKDKYKKLEEGRDNEYNVVKLGLQKRNMSLKVYPVRQLYGWRWNKVYTLRHVGSISENDSKSTEADIIDLQDMGFSLAMANFQYVYARWQRAAFVGEIVIQQGPPSMMGRYVNNPNVPPEVHQDGTTVYIMQKLFHENSENFINIYYYVPVNDAIGGASYIRYYTRSGGRDTLSYVGTNGYTWQSGYNAEYVWYQQNISNLMNSHTIHWRAVSNEEIPTIQAETFTNTICRFYFVFGRILNDKIGTVRDADTDISESNLRYWNIDDYRPDVTLSDRVSDEDKGHGQTEGGGYYDVPALAGEWEPLYRESWRDGFSLWVKKLPRCGMSQNTFETHTNNVLISDFYTLGDVIKAVVKQIDPAVEFETDTDHSAFLFSRTNPVSSQQQNTLYISQKSNVLNLHYDYPAWLAPITWGKIENLLKNAFGCYWDLVEHDGQTHLRIEHLTFYMNGGSYGADTRGILDLTTLRDTANRQPAAGKTNKWEWDTSGGGRYSSANRYEFGWMDTQSEIFDGATIEVPDSHRLFTTEKKEERKIDWFSSDIDFLTAVASECSSDGFAIVMEDFRQQGVVISGNANYAGQNYELSLDYLQPKYLIQGIYSARVKIGNTEYANLEIANMRTAEVSFQLPAARWETNPVTHETHDTWVSPTERLRTAAGIGVIDSLTYDLHSGLWSATLRYDND